jgi:hypothetical protein
MEDFQALYAKFIHQLKVLLILFIEMFLEVFIPLLAFCLCMLLGAIPFFIYILIKGL